MKNKCILAVIAFWAGLLAVVNAQAQQYPVTITGFTVQPSVFLSDYTSPGSGGMKATLRFTDYNEAAVDVYLKLTIEGTNAQLVTDPAYRPSAPCTLVPGEPYVMQDADFTPYFLPRNLLCRGISRQDLQQNGQFPDGWYTFTLQVMHLTGGKALSQPVSVRAYLALVDPPTLFTPEKGKFVKPAQSQITFQWQQNASTQLNRLEVDYYLRLYEIPEGEEPPVAMQNKSAREIYRSDAIRTRTYNYGVADMPLDPGKRYAYTITAQEAGGRKYFKNDGVSEAGWFYYGYPTGGTIPLVYPQNEEALNRQMIQKLSWDANDNLVDNTQPVVYNVKVVKLEADEEPVPAMNGEATWEYTSGELFNKTGYNTLIQDLDSEQRYAWQVKAFTEGAEVGKSAVQTFYAPPSIEEFVAGYGHVIEVHSLTNSKLDDLAGKGKVKVTSGGKKIEVHFEHLKIEEIDGLMLLTEGEIKCSVEGLMEPIILSPSTSVNDKAVCYPDSIRINDEGMYIKGRVEWDYPFATTSKDKSKVIFQPEWFNYNDDYRLSGTPKVVSDQYYNLLEPAKFYMQLGNNSYAQVLRNEWEMVFEGQIFVHDNVKGASRESYSIDFSEWRELHYNAMDNYYNDNELRLIANTQLNVVPRRVVVDLSEELSPPKFAGTPDWKGIYFEEFDLRFIPAVDDRGQLKLTQEVLNACVLTPDDTSRAWIIGNGLHFRYATQIAEEGIVQFNTFPSKIDILSIDIQKSEVLQAQLKGSIRIPVVSQTDRYTYTVPVTSGGFQTGYLDKSLEGLDFVFNETSPDQKLQASIKRAVFAGQNRLDMDLELTWDRIGVTFADLQQFCIWGNYEIGFTSPKGVANLTYQSQGIVEDYKINVEQMGCGRMCNQYAFAVAASVVIDNDISGWEGPPVLNFYSIADNVLLTGPCDLDRQDIQTSRRFGDEGNYAMTDEGMGEPDDDKTAEQIAAMNAENAAKTAAVEQIAGNLYALVSDVSFKNDNAVGNILGSIAENAADYITDKGLPEGLVNEVLNTMGGEVSLDNCIALVEMLLPLLPLSTNDQAIIKQHIGVVKKAQDDYYTVQKFIHDVTSGAIVEQLLDMAVDYVIAEMSKPLDEGVAIAKRNVSRVVGKAESSVAAELDKLLVKLIETVRTTAVNGLSQFPVAADAAAIVDKTLRGATGDIRGAVKTALKNSIDKNITQKVNNLIDTVVYARLLAFVGNELRTNLKQAVMHKGEGMSVKAMTTNAGSMLADVAADVGNFLSLDNVSNMLMNIGSDVLNAYSWKDLGAKLLADVAADVGVKALESEALKNITAEFGGGVLDDVLSNPNISDNISIDFDALKSGNLKEAIKFDPTHIVISSSVFEGEGYAKKLKDDPVYGDAFMAHINATIKVPKPFNAFATFVSGRQPEENFDYWFVEFGCRNLGLPMAPVPLVFDGGQGRVFKHMVRDETTKEYVPSIKNEFGAGVKAYFYDQTGGGIAAFNVDFSMEIEKEGFRLRMLGDAALGNVIEDGNIKKSLATGYGDMGYSSIENIFYAKAGMQLNLKPLICAGGEFNAYISPDFWEISVGTRENPVYAKLLCLDAIKMDSWFVVNKNMLDVGLHQLVDITARTPRLNLGFIKLDAYAKLRYEFGAELAVYWKPFKLRDAAIYLDVAIAVGIGYDLPWPLGGGDIDLLGVGLGGHLIYRSRTAAEMMALRGTPQQLSDHVGDYSVLSGRLYGNVTVVGFKIGLDMEAKKEWKS